MIWVLSVVLVLTYLSPLCAQEWDPFKDIQSDQLLQNPLTNAVDDDALPFAADWPIFWQEEKDLYVITITLDEEDLPSQLILDSQEQQIKLMLDKKVKFIRVPDNGDTMKLTHRISGDKIKITIPKRKLKSII